jgi:hypothetical protein
VRDHNQGRAALSIQFEHQVDHSATGGRIQAAGRLIGEQNRRLRHERARQCDPLLLSARKRTGLMLHTTAQTHAFEQFERQRPGRSAGRRRSDLQRERHILQGGQMVQQLERLKHEADPAGPQSRSSVFVQNRQILAEQADRA